MSRFRHSMVLLILLFLVLLNGCIQITIGSSDKESSEKGSPKSSEGCYWPFCVSQGGTGSTQEGFVAVEGTIVDIHEKVNVYEVKDSKGNIWKVPGFKQAIESAGELKKETKVKLVSEKGVDVLLIEKN